MHFPLTRIWQRYFIKGLLKVFFLFILCFYGLYVLLDFSSHAGSFHHHHIRIKLGEVTFYYLCDLIKRLDVLVPFALMIAAVKTLCGLNTHRELVALMASGIKLKTLLRPFIFVGLFFVFLMYLNTEFLLPGAMKKIKQISDSHSSQKNKYQGRSFVQHLILEDGSTLIFQEYNTSKHYFTDAYWIRNLSDIYRFKFLYPYTEVPQGHFVDHFKRNAGGELIHEDFNTVKLFPELHFNSATLLETLVSAEELPLSELGKKIELLNVDNSEKQAQNHTVFYYKLAMPWLCFLAIIAPAPFCVRYTRQLPQFLIYSGCIFGFVFIYLTFDAALILGKRQALDPFMAIGVPFALFFGFFSVRYANLRT